MPAKREAVAIAVCTSCKATRAIGAGEVGPGDMPFCTCGSIMVAKGAAVRRVRAKKEVRRGRR